MKRHYPAIVDTNKDRSIFGVTFPDLGGCTSGGETVEAAILNAADALAGHIALMAEDGDTIPEPTPVAEVDLNPGPDETIVCVILVPANLPGRTRRINVTLDENLIDEIDAVASNRSGFLSQAARAELSRRRNGMA